MLGFSTAPRLGCFQEARGRAADACEPRRGNRPHDGTGQGAGVESPAVATEGAGPGERGSAVGLRGTCRRELPMRRVGVKVRRSRLEERLGGSFLPPCPSLVFHNDNDDDSHLRAIP